MVDKQVHITQYALQPTNSSLALVGHYWIASGGIEGELIY